MSEKEIKCNECGRACCPYVYKGSNNTYLCGQGWTKGVNACGGNVCFKCGKIETRTELRKEEDCCGNEVMREREVEMFYQTEKDENDPDRQLKVYYCDEHKEEAKKSPLKWTNADDERIEKEKEQKKLEIETKIGSQKGLFYLFEPFPRSVEWKQVKGIKYGCVYFWGKENNQNFFLMVPDTHPVLNELKYTEKVKSDYDGREIEYTRYNLKEQLYLIEGVDNLPLEVTDSRYKGNDPYAKAYKFNKFVGLSDKIKITPVDSQGKSEKEDSTDINKPTDNLPNFQSRKWSDEDVLQFFKKSNIQSIKIKGDKLIIKYNHKEEEEEEEPNTNELQQTKSYLQKIGKQELSLSDLEQRNNNSNSPDKSNKGLYNGLTIVAVLAVGIIAWLLMRNKKEREI